MKHHNVVKGNNFKPMPVAHTQQSNFSKQLEVLRQGDSVSPVSEIGLSRSNQHKITLSDTNINTASQNLKGFIARETEEAGSGEKSSGDIHAQDVGFPAIAPPHPSFVTGSVFSRPDSSVCPQSKVQGCTEAGNLVDIKPINTDGFALLKDEPFTIVTDPMSLPREKFIFCCLNASQAINSSRPDVYFGYPHKIPEVGERRVTTLLSGHATLAAYAMGLESVEQFIAETGKVDEASKHRHTSFFAGGGFTIVEKENGEEVIKINLLNSFKSMGALEYDLVEKFEEKNSDVMTTGEGSTINGLLSNLSEIEGNNTHPIYLLLKDSSLSKEATMPGWLWPQFFESLVSAIGLPIEWDDSGVNSPYFSNKDVPYPHMDEYKIFENGVKDYINKANALLR